MPPQGIRLLSHSDILSYDEITAFSQLAVGKGICKIRITGGEPLVRKNVEKLIALIASIEGLTDLSLTTNGQLLVEKAALLKAQITRGGALVKTLAGIRAAQRAKLEPVKINCVIDINAAKGELQDEQQEAQKEAMRQFAQKEGLQLRFIHRMSLENGDFSIVEGGSGGDCVHCNRLRLTANGMLMPCLFSDLAYNILAMGYSQAIDAAIKNKPQKGTHNNSGNFYAIGG
jgi:cyclic pyranopterin phosphate synthase